MQRATYLFGLAALGVFAAVAACGSSNSSQPDAGNGAGSGASSGASSGSASSGSGSSASGSSASGSTSSSGSTSGSTSGSSSGSSTGTPGDGGVQCGMGLTCQGATPWCCLSLGGGGGGGGGAGAGADAGGGGNGGGTATCAANESDCPAGSFSIGCNATNCGAGDVCCSTFTPSEAGFSTTTSCMAASACGGGMGSFQLCSTTGGPACPAGQTCQGFAGFMFCGMPRGDGGPNFGDGGPGPGPGDAGGGVVDAGSDSSSLDAGMGEGG